MWRRGKVNGVKDAKEEAQRKGTRAEKEGAGGSGAELHRQKKLGRKHSDGREEIVEVVAAGRR